VNKTEKEIMEELEQLTAKQEEKRKTEITAGVTGNGPAATVYVDYSFNGHNGILYTYAGNAWRSKSLTDTELQGIGKVLMEAGKVHVWWTDSMITYVRGEKRT
jgi:hypothetical protein